jgi:parallel beta-helix repeat protein
MPEGDDSADGLTPKTAWQTIQRVNKADLKPGDIVRFAPASYKGPLLIRQSGEREKPIIFSGRGSVSNATIEAADACVDVAADHVFIDSFTLLGASDPKRAAMFVRADRDLRGISITRCHFTLNAAPGIHVDADQGKTVHQLSIIYNTFSSNADTPILIESAASGRVYGNAIQLEREPRPKDRTAIWLRSDRVKNVVVEQNRIRARIPDACAIRLTGTGAGIDIKDNDVYSSGDTGIWLENASGVSISGNIVRDVLTGIRITAGSHDHELTENTIVATHYGIMVDAKRTLDPPVDDPKCGIDIARNLILVAGRAAVRVSGGAEATPVRFERNRFDPPRFRWGDEEYESVAALEKVVGDTRSFHGPISTDPGVPTLLSGGAGASRPEHTTQPSTAPARRDQ